MRKITESHLSRVALLAELANAVREGDRKRAIQLAQKILRLRSTTTNDQVAIRKLMAALERPAAKLGAHSAKKKNSLKPLLTLDHDFIASGSHVGIANKVGPKVDRSKAILGDYPKAPGFIASSSKAGLIIKAGSKGGSSKSGHSKVRGFMAGRSMVLDPKSRSWSEPLCRPELSSRSQDGTKEIFKARYSSSKLMKRVLKRMERNSSPINAKVGRSGKLVSSRAGNAAGEVYPVWFGTNRKQDAQGFLGTELNDRIIRGRVDVYIPKAHRFGEAGNPFWRRLLRLDFRDDRLKVQRIQSLWKRDFYSEIGREMQAVRKNGDAPHALLFLHGYNVTFEEAAIRAAQIGCDLNVAGATAFFSWPSLGNASAYPADEARIEASEEAITNFLVEFHANCGAEKVHLIAHSMGNRGLLRALQRIAANAETRGKVKFGQIFLAAPDVDRTLFIGLARLYDEYAERTTLYASNGDKAVHLSAVLHHAPRAGYYTPYTVVPGVDTVAVPNFAIDLLGHSYFAKAAALLHDIYDLIRHNEPPNKRQRIEQATYDGTSFWTLRR